MVRVVLVAKLETRLDECPVFHFERAVSYRASDPSGLMRRAQEFLDVPIKGRSEVDQIKKLGVDRWNSIVRNGGCLRDLCEFAWEVDTLTKKGKNKYIVSFLT